MGLIQGQRLGAIEEGLEELVRNTLDQNLCHIDSQDCRVVELLDDVGVPVDRTLQILWQGRNP